MVFSMSNVNNEIVFEGWLTKSPPSKRIWKARWRRRWFVLKHSGELPGQFFLLYYTDRNCRKLKGTIDLDQCEQVDAGLRFENSKQNYPHMFDVKTPKRTYFLAAESESDMNKWVDCVCQVCGLRATIEDTSVEFIEENTDCLQGDGDLEVRRPRKTEPTPDRTYSVNLLDEMNESPTSSVSGPYIPISECHSGKPLNTPKGISDFNNIISRQELSNSKLKGKDCFTQPQQSYKVNIRNNLKSRREDKITNIESAKKIAERRIEAVNDEFYDSPRKVVAEDEWQRPVMPAAPPPNWDTFPAQEDSDFSPGDIGSWSVVERFGKLTVVDSRLPIVTNSLNRVCRQQRRQPPDTHSLRRPVAPPRPPKPQRLTIQEQPNAEDVVEPGPASVTALESPLPTAVVTSDETYDVPRSHQPQEVQVCSNDYTNTMVTQTSGNVFRYDFTDSDTPSATGEPISPSPLVNAQGIATPPAVNRELKPSRKMSDSGASSEPSPGPYTPSLGPISPPNSAEPSPLGFGPPSIDRTLKPKKPPAEGSIKLARPPDGSLGMRRVRAGPSPTLPHSSASGSKRTTRTRSDHSSGGEDDHRRSPDQEQIYFYERNSALYSQMNLTHIQYLDLDLDSDAGAGTPGPVTTPPATAGPSSTPYKTIDFIKTQAFNRTREEVEEKRKEVKSAD